MIGVSLLEVIQQQKSNRICKLRIIQGSSAGLWCGCVVEETCDEIIPVRFGHGQSLKDSRIVHALIIELLLLTWSCFPMRRLAKSDLVCLADLRMMIH